MAYDLKARLLIDGQLGPDQSVPEVAVGDDATFAFLPNFATPGDHLIEVRIDDDPLPLDNRRRLAVPVREALSVLLVDGHPKAEPFQGETDYLAEALNPEEKSAGSPSQIRTTVVNESQLGTRDLAPFDAVALCNIAQFTPAEVAALDAYLKQGGGIVVFGGDQVIADNYNQLLFAGGQGLLPPNSSARWGMPSRLRGRSTSTPRTTSIRSSALLWGPGQCPGGPDRGQDDAVSQAQDPRRPAVDGPGGALFRQRRPRRDRDTPAPGAGHPGRDLGGHWLDHLAAPLQLPADHGADFPRSRFRRMSERNVRVGQPLDQALPATAAGASVEVTRPDEARLPSKIKAAGDVSLFHFEDTDLSGAYQPRIGPPLAVETLFAANPDPAESDPAKLDRVALAEAVPGWKFAYFTNWKDLTGNSASVGRRGELHRPLLYALLVLLIVESIAAWRFGHH